MALHDVTNTRRRRRHPTGSSQFRKLVDEIRSEQELLQQLCQETAVLRLQLQIRHFQYRQQKSLEEFLRKQRDLVHSHLRKKAELVSARKSQMDRKRASYKAQIDQIRARTKQRRVGNAFEANQSIRRVEQKITESNRKSLGLLQLQLEDSQAVILQTVRSLQSQVDEAFQRNRSLEEVVSGLQSQRCLLTNSSQDLQTRFRTMAEKFADCRLQSEDIPVLRQVIERCYQKTRESFNRAQALMRRRKLNLRDRQKQVMIYRHALGRAISERDALYDRFVYVIETLSEKNRRLENESNERIRALSQKLINETTGANS